MSRQLSVTRALMGVAVVALSLAGCGAKRGSDATATTTTTTQPSASTSTTETGDTTGSTTTIAASVVEHLDSLVKKALLVPADLGAHFKEVDAAGQSTGPCGATDPDDDLVPVSRGRTSIDHETLGLSAQENIRVYRNHAEAGQAYDMFKALVGCSSGTITSAEGTTTDVELATPDDVASVNDHIDEGFGEFMSAPGVDAYLVAVRVGSTVITLSLTKTTDPSTTGDFKINHVIDQAVTKVVDA